MDSIQFDNLGLLDYINIREKVSQTAPFYAGIQEAKASRD